jgi:hypothetical protein
MNGNRVGLRDIRIFFWENDPMMKRIVVIGAVALLAVPVAMAKERSFGACAADVKAKCAEVKPGGGRIKECVKTHAAEFSEPCKERFARVAEISKACAVDIKENCPGKERSCILKSIGNFKDQCKEALAQLVAGRK